MKSMHLGATLERIPRLIMIFFLIDLGLCFTYLLNHLIGRPFSIVTRILNLNGESTLSSWYSSVQLFCIFILAAIVVCHEFRKNSKSLLLIPLPTIFLLMSIDETVQIHEWLGDKSDMLLPGGSRSGTIFSETGIWMFVIGLPFFALFLLWAYSIKLFFSEQLFNIKKLVIGMSIFLLGALGIETLSNITEHSIEVVFEEGLEMIGATVILWAVYDMALKNVPGMDLVMSDSSLSGQTD